MAPGIQEEFMLDFILERVRDGGYDLVVWDTAPPGDTLRLLELPYRFLEHLRTAPRVYLSVRDKLQLKKVPFLELIDSWRELSQEITAFFRDPANAEFILVTIPEALGCTRPGAWWASLPSSAWTSSTWSSTRHRPGRFRVLAAPAGDAAALPGAVGAGVRETMNITRLPLFAEEMKGTIACAGGEGAVRRAFRVTCLGQQSGARRGGHERRGG
jgi:hypothetical protein